MTNPTTELDGGGQAMKGMTVAELIVFLLTQPQDLLVAYQIYSEQALLEPGDISVVRACHPRADGWIHNKRPDRPTREYLMFPGN